MELPVRVYTPESRSLHPGVVAREIIDGLRHSRTVAMRLVTRDIRSEYSVAAFGLIWDVLDPLVLAGIFCLLYQSRVMPTADLPIHYSVYVVFGMLLYQCFVEATLLSMESMKRARTLITQVRVPPEALPMASFFRVCFNSSFRFGVMLAVGLIAGQLNPLGLIQAVLLFPVMLMAGVAIGTLFAPFNSIYSDFGRFIRVLFVGLRFVTPTVFFYSAGSLMNTVNFFNPIALFVRNIRSLATQGQWYAPDLLITHVAVLGVVGVIGLFIFHISVPVVAERL
jgi:ABC-type polysaccharide/polyol phosphate export permease